MTKNRALLELLELGQSVWYDNLSKEVLEDGTLKDLVARGVRGLTSNPTIFKNAIADSSSYDELIQNALHENASVSVEALTEQLMVRDVAAAADMLQGVYVESKGDDGYASIEVSPLLAHDAAATIEEAQRLWKILDRPNIMIKVPATEEGVQAIETLLYEGINVNVTLIFSAERYKAVAKAYVSALSRRLSEGKNVDSIASVASFFVSRVDALSEKRLGDSAAPFLGKIGIANSKIAYQSFQEIFEGESFRELLSAGARVQRPLWASTGTKNPEFDPLLYVKELVGKDTVNTLPPKTLEFLMESNTSYGATVSKGFRDADKLLATLSEILDFHDVLSTLEKQGVEAFSDSYQELLASVKEKVKRLKS